MKLTFDKVVQHFDGIPALADSLNISPHAIYQWKKIPVLRCHEIESLSGGVFKLTDLRDIEIEKGEAA